MSWWLKMWFSLAFKIIITELFQILLHIPMPLRMLTLLHSDVLQNDQNLNIYWWLQTTFVQVFLSFGSHCEHEASIYSRHFSQISNVIVFSNGLFALHCHILKKVIFLLSFICRIRDILPFPDEWLLTRLSAHKAAYKRRKAAPSMKTVQFVHSLLHWIPL